MFSIAVPENTINGFTMIRKLLIILNNQMFPCDISARNRIHYTLRGYLFTEY